MPLPILHARYERSDRDLVRLYHQTESRWAEHLADPEPLHVGTAYANPKLPNIFDANHVAEVSLPEGMTPQDAYDLVQSHFRSRGSRCAYWTLNPSSPESATQPLADHLISLNYRPLSTTLLALDRIPPIRLPSFPDLKIIPTRAAQRHARALFEESAAEHDEPQFADAELLHLDDPHWDSLLALKNGAPLATAGVLAVGEIGRIDQVYVAKAHRRQGLGLLLLARTLETCARSLFKHVLLTCHPDNTPAMNLYARLGFRAVGPITSYFAPGLDPRPRES